ncbi:DUF2407 C-terminal domain-containing protein [Daldinia caldariorum]|uniref:DUF2407 C-terminal domain-containing protein n=1 Tax=Daldinia caldariorum TaxID=326644 RepID=UPI002008E9EE|nr:DUF2407 C-terminal domain-containing protein [Daldinia caldariorum]KAI1471458.1 DUF2407 C-terminal domain-containing protein [Daldinia caldariorum]
MATSPPPPPPPSTLNPPPSSSPSAPSPPPLLLTIRFSASIPDLELDIPRPSLTTVVSLKHLIRQRLEEPNSQRRLRFIHGGKILPDNAVLSAVLRAPPLPPPPPRGAADYGSRDARGGGAGGIGNGREREKGKSVPGRPEPPQRIYVNCSIGDSLTTAELEAEAAAAAAPPPPAPSQSASSPRSRSPVPPPDTPLPSTSAAPRGFDRLLSAGFTAAEVNQLRLQFRSIHASRFTPDTLPSPDSFRRMEDAWIDDNGASMPSTGALGGGNSGGGGGMGGLSNGTDSDEVGLVALVDVMIRGVMTGFMWPLGSAGWLVREEGMASGRWRFMVGVGVMFSVLIGIIRSISGER